MTFFSIVPRSKGFMKNYSNAIPLKVVQSNGITTKPNLNITVSDLSKGYKHFYNSGSVGITFKITIIINKDEKVQGKLLTQLLDNYIRNMTPLLVHTDAIDIPDGKNDAYIITKNDSRKQDYLKYTEWDLEFTTYTPLKVYKYSTSNKSIKNALNSKLAKCDYKILKYSKKKKVVKCVKYLQKVLKRNKCYSGKIDGWYGKSTVKAVKKFQKKYNKKHRKTNVLNTSNHGIIVRQGKLITNPNSKFIEYDKTLNGEISFGETLKIKQKNIKNPKISKMLKVTGKIDKATWKALCNS